MTTRVHRESPSILNVYFDDGSVRTYQGPKASIDKDEARERAELVSNSSKLVRNQPRKSVDADNEPLTIPVMNFDPIQHTNPIAGLPDTDKPGPSYFGAAGAPVGNEDDDQPLVPPIMNFDAPTQRPLGGVHNETVRNRGTGGQHPVNSSHSDDSEALSLPPTTF